MGTTIAIPPDSNFLQPVRRFEATFNAPTLNKYDFGVNGNTLQKFLAMKASYVYLFDTFSFSASMDEGVFLGSVDTKNGIPSTKAAFRIPSQDNRILYRGGIPLVNYVDAKDVQFYAYSEQDESLTIDFEGVLSQSQELVGVSSIFAQITCDVYEIRNKDWIDNFLGRTKNGQGKNLL